MDGKEQSRLTLKQPDSAFASGTMIPWAWAGTGGGGIDWAFTVFVSDAGLLSFEAEDILRCIGRGLGAMLGIE